MSGYVSSVHSITEKPNNETITEITNFDSEKVVGLYAKTKAEAAKYSLYTLSFNSNFSNEKAKKELEYKSM